VITNVFTLNGTSTGHITGSGAGNGPSLSLNGTGPVTTNGATATGGTIYFGGGTSQVIPAGTFYYNVDITPNNAIKLGGDITCNLLHIYGTGNTTATLDTNGHNVSAASLFVGLTGDTTRWGNLVNTGAADSSVTMTVMSQSIRPALRARI